jgi:Ni/Co efflux regulator RcnB
MRTLRFRGLASTAALLSVALAGSADSAPAGSTMTTGAAPREQSAQSWGNVPELGLRPPVTAPAPAPATVPDRGGWGPGGWQGGDAPLPGGPALGAPDELAAGSDRPGGWRSDREPRDGAWRGRAGDGPDYGSGRAAWSGRYNRVGRGYVVPGYLRAPNFEVSDWWTYGLGRPGYGQYWIRYYDDALLIDGGGRVVDTRYGLDWDRAGPTSSYAEYGDGDGYEPGNYDRGFREDGVRIYRSGPGAPDVTVHRREDGSTVVVIPNQPTTGTTTTTYYDEVVPVRRTPRRPARRR